MPDYGPSPWYNKELMEEMYTEQEMPMVEIAEEFNTSQQTIKRWLKNHGLEVRPRGYHARKKFPNFRQIDSLENPYEVVEADGYTVGVHRLLAVSEYGFDSVVDKHVHHENGIPWDNRPDNITPLSPSEHGFLHGSGRFDPHSAESIQQ